MATYTQEAKFPMPDYGSGGQGADDNWGAVVNGILEALDAGAELTFVFGENVTAGDCVALKSTDGKVYRAASNDSTLTPAIGFAPNTVAADAQGKVRWFGWIDVDTSFSFGDSVSWSAGECMYVGSWPGRLAKTRYSWASPVGWAKSHTDAALNTRFAIHPKHRCSEIVTDLTAEKKIVFVGEVDNGNSGASKTIDWGQGNHQSILLTDDPVLSFAHPFGIGMFTLRVVQDASGSRTVTWPSSVKWPGGTAPTLTITGDAIDVIRFYFDGLTYHGVSQLDYQ
jgi:hypothetical protein